MEQASLNIGTIGQRLEAARQSKGVSVSEAGQATKILSKFIEAMESDDFGALSAPVYAKSFIKMYASYLGLDARPLVDEYVAQHAPRNKGALSEEVRQKLAKADVPPTEPKPKTAPTANGKAKQVFGSVNEAVAALPGSGFPLKYVLPVVGVVLVGIIVLSATQCAEDEGEAPAPTGAASIQRQTITQGVPDAYLVEPGVVEVDKK
jgi:hypothetical protein